MNLWVEIDYATYNYLWDEIDWKSYYNYLMS